VHRLGKAFGNARRMYEKFVTINQQLNDYWAAARNYESMITLTLDCDDKILTDELVKITAKASNYFKLSDSMTNYISLATRVCKYLEKNGNFSYACDLYEQLIKDLEDNDNYYIRNEAINNYVSLLVNMTEFTKVIQIYEKEIEYHRKTKEAKVVNLNQMALALICMYLIVGDIDKADSRLQFFMTGINGFFKSNEVTAAEKLVDSYIDGNQQEFNTMATKPVVTALFPANIVKNLRKVIVKACPNKRKVQNLDDLMDTNIQISPTNDNSQGNPSGNIAESPKLPKTEEEKKKMLEDFIS